MKSKWNLAAAAIMVITVVAHVFGGGPEIWLPVYESGLSEPVRITMGLVWLFGARALTWRPKNRRGF